MGDIDDQLELAIEAYEQNGIVTRNDCGCMDSRPGSRKICEMMQELGYKNSILMEVQIGNYADYSNILYNSEMYNIEQAKEYMRKYVLHD